jgi:hypothetical protein
VTAILLNADLAMRERSLPPGATKKRRVGGDLVERMRDKLEGSPEHAKGGVLRPGLTARQAAISRG